MSSNHPNNHREKSPLSLRRRLLLGGLAGGALMVVGQISDAWWSSFFKPAPSPTLYTYSGHPSGVSSVAWSPDGTRIASGGRDRFVRVWRVF
jgi:WD40 repeat protein